MGFDKNGLIHRMKFCRVIFVVFQSLKSFNYILYTKALYTADKALNTAERLIIITAVFNA